MSYICQLETYPFRFCQNHNAVLAHLQVRHGQDHWPCTITYRWLGQSLLSQTSSVVLYDNSDVPVSQRASYAQDAAVAERLHAVSEA